MYLLSTLRRQMDDGSFTSFHLNISHIRTIGGYDYEGLSESFKSGQTSFQRGLKLQPGDPKSEVK